MKLSRSLNHLTLSQLEVYVTCANAVLELNDGSAYEVVFEMVCDEQ